MPRWRSVLANIATDLQSHVANARRDAGKVLGRDPLQIAVFRGYGTAERAFVTGRVLEDEGLTAATVADPRWRNLINALKRLESDEVPHARVRIRFAGCHQEVVSDNEGYFSAWLTPSEPIDAGKQWHTCEVELIASPTQNSAIRAWGEVLVPPASAEFAVISDIDDTVIQTGATDLVRMARATLFENSRTRLPFPGVAAFYRALHNGAQGSALNPVFYVSSSPWNLYDLLTDFLDLQRIPAGPLMLRDWDFALERPKHGPHKLGAIAQIMELYPDLPVILIGDSGQEDPEIYRGVVARYPKRILAAYIRNVTPNPERSAAVRALAEEVIRGGSTLILADDTLAAARHAAEHGWIDPRALGAIASEKSNEEAGKPGTPVSEAPSQPAPTAPTVVIEGRPPVREP